ncbi:MAG: hypothetical protein M9939_23590 [Mesorhizobium sp.]|nr:hypothetical protein [Mesorhizobium sp.]MCO5164087.1 hypothetical protein [Mesorhizobium sp.]
MLTPLAADHRRGDDQLSEYADLPHPPAEWASALPDLIVEETRLQTELTGIKQREKKVREDLEGLGDAVNNAIELPWSNGQAEGQINRLTSNAQCTVGPAPSF